MPASAQSEASTMSTDEKAVQFYYLPIVMYVIEMANLAGGQQITALMDVGDNQHAFVTYSGRKPTVQELRNESFKEKWLPTFVEARSPEEARQIFISANPGTQGQNPALRFDHRAGRAVKLVPSCDYMQRGPDKVYCEMKPVESGPNSYLPCIVSGGRPPAGCPIDNALNPSR